MVDGRLRSKRLCPRCPPGRRELMVEAEEEERDTAGTGEEVDLEVVGAPEEMDGEEADGVKEAEGGNTITDSVIMDIRVTVKRINVRPVRRLSFPLF